MCCPVFSPQISGELFEPEVVITNESDEQWPTAPKSALTVPKEVPVIGPAIVNAVKSKRSLQMLGLVLQTVYLQL